VPAGARLAQQHGGFVSVRAARSRANGYDGSDRQSEGVSMPILLSLTVNGRPVEIEVEPQTLLVELLRGPLALTGTHVGCDTAQCGACTVLLDGQAVKSCSMLALQAQGRNVDTVEGLARDGNLHPVQEAFIACHGLQCGFCTPGMMMTAVDLLTHQPQPSEAEIVHALEGNLCRCTGYVNIVAAVQQAAQAMGGPVGSAS
jgi:carbon-monoxide dehydrogenase small subunit